ncbi:hypothetical protein CK556_00175 [Mesoplasma chauliocola]|uniref:Uncharacterized protein n=1 Tax=Mesoplasma chauliocola TaxID=216427 RepID=A0A249SM89_9MOLU|nr:lipoprotein [Mesoplasma chauliocola]ASZ08785.1 hypothetical protein CK556_00175 [Mesoplasma chauliocola]
MKKLLSVLTASVLATTAASSVVSCGTKPEKKVVFVLPQETIGQNSKDKQTAYQDLVDEFNQEHAQEIANGELVEIEARWEKSGNIAKNIAANGNLPDLYIFYPDAVSTFSHSGASEKVRDMEESMGDNFAEFKNSLLNESFIDEGVYNGKQIVLPFGKSVDLSVINVRVLAELAKGFGFDEEGTIKTSFETYNETSNSRKNLWGTTKDASKMSTYSSFGAHAFDIVKKSNDKKVQDALKTFEEIVQTLTKSTDISKDIRDIFREQENIFAIATLTTELYREKDGIKYSDITETISESNGQKAAADKAIEAKQNSSQHFGFSIDSMENKYFMDWAAANQEGKSNINIESNANEFMYNAQLNKNSNGKVQSTSVELNKNSTSFQKTTSLYDGFKEIAKTKNELSGNNTDIEKSWKGTFMTKYNGTSGSIYTSTAFQNGTTLVGSGSSAGAYNYTSGISYKYNGDKNTGYLNMVKNSDILTTSTIGNEKDAFMSQGPGIAGFKSTGDNAAQKEETVSKFLSYIMQPKQAADFALKTNYMPPTTDAMKIYQKYVDGTYNNQEAFQYSTQMKQKAVEYIEKNPNRAGIPSKEEIEEAHYLDGGHLRVTLDSEGNASNISFKKGGEPITEKIQALNDVYDHVIHNEKSEELDQWRFEKLFTPIADYSSSLRANSRASVSAINSGYINDFLFDNEGNKNTQTLLVTSTPSPIGTDVRDGIKSAIVEAKNNTVMYNWDIKFNQLLDEENNVYNLSKYLNAKSGDDVLKRVTVSYRK